MKTESENVYGESPCGNCGGYTRNSHGLCDYCTAEQQFYEEEAEMDQRHAEERDRFYRR